MGYLDGSMGQEGNQIRKMSKAPRKHYINNKDFFAAILDHKEKVNRAQELGLPKPRISDYCGECIYQIATRLATKPCYVNYSFRSEMISDAIENCIMYFDTFNPYLRNSEGKPYSAFAYVTQICLKAFHRRIAKEKRQQYTTYKYFQETILNTGGGDFLYDDDNHLIPKESYDNINVFMADFEEKEKEKKTMKLAKAAEKNLNNSALFNEVDNDESKEKSG